MLPIKRKKEFVDSAKQLLNAYSKEKKKVFCYDVSLCGGKSVYIPDVGRTLRDLILPIIINAEKFVKLGGSPIKGVILHGPGGSGKSRIVKWVAAGCGCSVFRISGSDLLDTDFDMKELFEAAKENNPSIVLIENTEFIGDKGCEISSKLFANLASCIDDITGSIVTVLLTTSKLDNIPSFLRSSSRLSRELSLSYPDYETRKSLLLSISQELSSYNFDDVDFDLVSQKTSGFVAADLKALLMAVVLSLMYRGDSENRTDSNNNGRVLDTSKITTEFIMKSLGCIVPGSKKEGFSEVPVCSWNEVGALDNVKKELRRWVCDPVKNPKFYESVGLESSCGILFYGPPGCGKTLLARAVAAESGASFISVKGPELLNKYVGESERAVREIFQRASTSTPCVIFFDEIDSLCLKRGEGQSVVGERVVNQFLTELDGISKRRHIIVIAATNRVDMLDPAILRPGRFEKKMLIPLPDTSSRLDILKTLSQKFPIDKTVDFSDLLPYTTDFSGADLHALLREATMMAIHSETHKNKHNKNYKDIRVTISELRKALQGVVPSVHEKNAYQSL